MMIERKYFARKDNLPLCFEFFFLSEEKITLGKMPLESYILYVRTRTWTILHKNVSEFFRTKEMSSWAISPLSAFK